jgi:biotin carboxylase
MSLLLLSTTTGYQLRSFGDAARELGVEIVFATDRCHTLDDPWRDAAVPVRFHDEEASLAAIVAAGRVRPIEGVLAVGDRPVVLAARAAEALGLPGNPPGAARASAHKRLARECFAQAGLLVPAFLPISIDQGIEEAAATVEYPVVLKPVGLSGSRGVVRADDSAQLRAAFGRVAALLARPEIRAQRTGLERELLIEAFVEGPEYAIEGLLTDGAFTALAIFDKPDPLDGPFFEETIYVTPSRLTDSIQTEIADCTAGAAAALGLRHGPVHAELRINEAGPWIVEIAGRSIGGLCSQTLRFGPDVSLEELILRQAVGLEIETMNREDIARGVMMIPIPEAGLLKSIKGIEAAEAVPGIESVEITAQLNQPLVPLPEGESYLGFIFAEGQNPADVEAALREAHRQLEFELAPMLPIL